MHEELNFARHSSTCFNNRFCLRRSNTLQFARQRKFDPERGDFGSVQIRFRRCSNAGLSLN